MTKHSEFTVEFEIPEDMSQADALRLADDVLEEMRRRAQAGKGVRGVDGTVTPSARSYDFAEYSDAYVKSRAFKIAGKKAGQVDLTLTGDMLAEMEILNKSRMASEGRILIGYRASAESIGRVEGNLLGTYGSDRPNRKKARYFLGLPWDDYQRLLSHYE